MEVELFSQIESLESGRKAGRARAQHVTDRLIELAPVFTKTSTCSRRDFTMLDVAIAPLLWRLDHYASSSPRPLPPLMKYRRAHLSRPDVSSEALNALGKSDAQ